MSARNAAKTKANNISRPPAANSAFKAQSRKELGKLKSTLAEHLRKDMKRYELKQPVTEAVVCYINWIDWRN